jgi:heavy metal translocating P-type ATPase
VRYRLPIAATLAILAGGAAMLLPNGSRASHLVWTAGLALCGAPVVYSTLRGLFRGKFAADVIASMTVVTALALGHPIVGLVIVIMQTGGEALERLAEGRASEALRALQETAPRKAHRVTIDSVEEIDVSEMQRGDVILVRPGEIVPCDGEIIAGRSHLDTATLTGEPLPRKASVGDTVLSGSINKESPLTIRANVVGEESQFARIVALVREAQTSKAPLQRIADRFAAWFTPATVTVCVVAFLISGEWDRVLAVLAIATPCPLILATPVAILGGMNRSARRQILVRNGGALEALARTSAIVFDKTGTITVGQPRVSRVLAVNSVPESEVLRLASAVEQGSGHLLARTLVTEARERGLLANTAAEIVEAPGRGVEGEIEGRHVAVGARSFIAERYPATKNFITDLDVRHDHANLRAYVAIDGEVVGLVEYGDMIRDGIADLVKSLHAANIPQVLLLSGDRAENVRAIAHEAGIHESRGDMLPEDKVAIVKRLIDDGQTVVMLGDGTNDAPALGTASVGIALASHGRGIATEAADVILLADDPSRVLDAIMISRRTMRIARQSIWFGLAVSGIGMVFAAAGAIVPIAGAAIQEVVDLAVILNALRASRSPLYGKR